MKRRGATFRPWELSAPAGPRSSAARPGRRGGALRRQRVCPSCRRRWTLPEDGGDLPPAVDPAQPDLPARHETEEQYDGGVFTRERALRLHPAAEFFVEPLDDVCGAQRLPLPFREPEEGEQFVAAL